MISCLEIKKLFNRFDYTIELQRNTITILTGPNGFGKSTILKIISALSSTNVMFFYKLDFQEIIITFDDNTTFSIEKKRTDGGTSALLVDKQELPFHLFASNATRVPWIHRVSPNEWMDFRTRERFGREDLFFHLFDDADSIEDISNYFNISPKKAKEYSFLIEKIKTIAEKSGNVRLISEQRLIRKEIDEDDDEQIVDVISELPEKMKARISQLTADYSKAANSLDSTYPQRLLSTKKGLSGKEEFQEKMENANIKFAKLSKYDLVDLPFIRSTNYEAEFSKALKISFEDFEKKYSVFADFIERLDLYTDIINSHLSFKSIRITRESGLVVVDNDDPNHILKLEQLSSGEKQEIVLFYELIFETEKQLLLLIDEPEISLHIMWQKLFMEDLDRVVSLGNLKVIVATHAPQIINNRWDLQIDLGELYGN